MTRPSPSYPDTFQGLRQILARLRSPGGCPWDREQTHSSLRRFLLEECYEALEALDQGDSPGLMEELGDILLQMAFHIQVAEEKGEFTEQELFHRINEKLLRRHPHVFGAARASSARQVEEQWEDLRQKERGEESILSGVPKEMPALAYCQAISQRAARAGFEWEDLRGVLDKVAEELDELERAKSTEEREDEVGDVLFSLVNVARWLEADAESALRKSNGRFYKRFAWMEEVCRQRGLSFKEMPLVEKEALWQEAKRRLAQG